MTAPEEVEVDPENGPREEPPAGRGRLLPALLVLSLVLVAAAGVLGGALREQRSVESAREEALEVARDTAEEVLSYDHRRMADDIAEAEAVSTGRLLEQYRDATDGLVEQAEAGSAVVRADVQAASVESASQDRVAVLLFVDQTTVREGLAEPLTEQNRIRLTLRHVDGRWLASDLDAL